AMTRLISRGKKSARKTALGAAGVLGFLLVWQLIPALGIVDQQFFPSATETLAKLASNATGVDFWNDIRNTMTSWAIGLAIATVAGVVLGTLIGLIPVIRRGTHTTIEFLRPIPSVALIPLAVVVFGLRLEAALVIIV